MKTILYLLIPSPKFEKIFSVTFMLPKKAITIPENIPNIDIDCALESRSCSLTLLTVEYNPLISVLKLLYKFP
ncbi:hypothetical protein CFSAN002367_16793 [Clostridium botulinum CFSAN002367]|nr:hypothetical protein CFSAN002367_16793 [Clostridium botulinum CFSAN002367]RHW66430.1 hypothetical protein DZC34_02615 [Clostridium botulinum]